MYDTSPDYLNPWFSIWTQPRNTIQQVVDEDPQRMVLLLVILPTLMQSCTTFIINILHGRQLTILPFFIIGVICSIASIIILYFHSAVTRWTGKWFDGQASSENIRAAIAWSMVPAIFMFSLALLGVALFGLISLSGNQPAGWATNMPSWGETVFMVLQGAAVIWSFALYVGMLSQVQGFSIYKALGNALVSALIVVVFIVGMLLVLSVGFLMTIGFKM
jgi:hypothetical protein